MADLAEVIERVRADAMTYDRTASCVFFSRELREVAARKATRRRLIVAGMLLALRAKGSPCLT